MKTVLFRKLGIRKKRVHNLPRKMLDFIVDDNPEKQGKFTPGDHILVKPTSTIYEKKPDYLFILAWIHAKKIMRENKKYIDEGGHFIICFPEVKVIGKKEINKTFKYQHKSNTKENKL